MPWKHMEKELLKKKKKKKETADTLGAGELTLKDCRAGWEWGY